MIWVLTLSTLLTRCKRFREIYCLYCQSCFSEVSVSSYKPTLCQNPEQHHCEFMLMSQLKCDETCEEDDCVQYEM